MKPRYVEAITPLVPAVNQINNRYGFDPVQWWSLQGQVKAANGVWSAASDAWPNSKVAGSVGMLDPMAFRFMRKGSPTYHEIGDQLNVWFINTWDARDNVKTALKLTSYNPAPPPPRPIFPTNTTEPSAESSDASFIGAGLAILLTASVLL